MSISMEVALFRSSLLSSSTITHSHHHRPSLTRALTTHVSTRHQLGLTGGLPNASLFASLTPPRCILSSDGSADSGGGDGGGVTGGGGDGGWGDGSDGGDSKVGEALRASDDVLEASTDFIVLDVGGMTCGGCAAKVKLILESQPQVSSANVVLATETVIVWPVDAAKVMPNWQQELGETLAKHLTSCGFQSKLRGLEGNEEPVAQ